MSYAHLLPYAPVITPIMLVVGVLWALYCSYNDTTKHH